jgi:DNA invertase Pin-like site-specific DNA recombinase
LNILLSFAQFEREIISERTRDKMAAARRRGKYAGGRPILGYDLLSHPTGSKLRPPIARFSFLRHLPARPFRAFQRRESL